MARHRSGKGIGAYIGLLLAAAFFACALAVFLGALRGGAVASRLAHAGGSSADEEANEALEPKPFSDYTWDEIAQIAALIEQAPSDEDARAVAREYGIIDGEGRITGEARAVELSDGTVCAARVVGVRADERSDGQGPAGLTFVMGPISSQAMNDGGADALWEGSSLRAWLSQGGEALLPEDLRARIVGVNKACLAADESDPTGLAVAWAQDRLWAPSASEVFGTVTWLAQEYGDAPIANTGYVDFAPYDALLCSEGAQYEYFAQAGVADREDPGGCLAGFLGELGSSWWLRTAYPPKLADLSGEAGGLYFQVTASGYPSTLLGGSQQNGVVVGFCI